MLISTRNECPSVLRALCRVQCPSAQCPAPQWSPRHHCHNGHHWSATIAGAQVNAESIEWGLQQHWAAAQRAKETLERCESYLPGFWTKDVGPGRYHFLNLLVFAFRGIREQNVCSFKAQIHQIPQTRSAEDFVWNHPPRHRGYFEEHPEASGGVYES